MSHRLARVLVMTNENAQKILSLSKCLCRSPPCVRHVVTLSKFLLELSAIIRHFHSRCYPLRVRYSSALSHCSFHRRRKRRRRERGALARYSSVASVGRLRDERDFLHNRKLHVVTIRRVHRTQRISFLIRI